MGCVAAVRYHNIGIKAKQTITLFSFLELIFWCKERDHECYKYFSLEVGLRSFILESDRVG